MFLPFLGLSLTHPPRSWTQEAYALKGKLEPGQLAKVQRKAELEQVPETWRRFFLGGEGHSYPRKTIGKP